MDQKRFIGRKEFFGSLIYDSIKHVYIYFNKNATDVLDGLTLSNLEEVYSNLKENVTRRQFDEFIELAKTEGIIDSENKFRGYIRNSNFSNNQLSAPEQIYYGITYECPGRCIHCYTDSGYKRSNELNTDEAKRFIDEASSIGICRMSIDGGEPLCRNDLLDIIGYMKMKNIDVSMTTDAWLINDSNARVLSDLNLKTITVSFDGGTKETFEYIRGKGNFDRTIEGAKLLRKYSNRRLALRMTLMKPNKDEIPQLISIAEAIGYDAVKISAVRLYGRAKHCKKIEITKQDFIETIQSSINLKEKTKVDLILPSFPYIYATKKRINLGEPNNRFDLGFGCVGGLTTSYVSPEGNVTPCCFLGEEFISGNLRHNSFKEIWDHGSGFKKKRTVKRDENCSKCNGYENCEGGCRSRALYEFGDINAPDPFCLFLKEDEINEYKRASTKSQKDN